jgi:hypothetical protein
MRPNRTKKADDDSLNLLRLEAHMPAELAVVTGFDVQKQRVFLTMSGDRRIVLPLHLCAGAREGEVWRLRLQADGKRVQRAELWAGEAPGYLIRRFEGKLQQKPGQRFAFAGGVYIPEGMLRAANVAPGEHSAGWALRVYNPAKEVWGWRALVLQKSDG